MVYIEPLDLEYLLVNTFAGSMEIFIGIAIIVILSLMAYFRMRGAIIVGVFALFTIIMSQYMSGIYFIVVLIIGVIISFVISKVVK